MRMWHVTVQNMPETYSGTFSEGERVAAKFTIASGALSPEDLEKAMQLEIIMALRKVKEKMIMEGIEP